MPRKAKQPFYTSILMRCPGCRHIANVAPGRIGSYTRALLADQGYDTTKLVGLICDRCQALVAVYIKRSDVTVNESGTEEQRQGTGLGEPRMVDVGRPLRPSSPAGSMWTATSSFQFIPSSRSHRYWNR